VKVPDRFAHEIARIDEGITCSVANGSLELQVRIKVVAAMLYALADASKNTCKRTNLR
jgi:hypothetical protein